MIAKEQESISDYIKGFLAILFLPLILFVLAILGVLLSIPTYFFWIFNKKDFNNTKPLYYLNKSLEGIFD